MENIRKILDLIEEFCDQVDAGTEDVGGGRAPLTILREIGPLVGAAKREVGVETGEIKGLPVAGYKPTQSQASIDLVNEGKQIEERALRWLKKVIDANIAIGLHPEASEFMLHGKMDIQKGFMLLYRAVFQPKGSRIALPEDAAEPARDWRETTTGS